jgi:hypothetical protein
MAYPEKWNAIHRLVVITGRLVDESVEMDFDLPYWAKIPDILNPWSKSIYQLRLESLMIPFLKKDIGVDAEASYNGLHIKFKLEKCVFEISLMQNGPDLFIDPYYSPYDSDFWWKISWTDVDGKKQTETGSDLNTCRKKIKDMKNDPNRYHLIESTRPKPPEWSIRNYFRTPVEKWVYVNIINFLQAEIDHNASMGDRGLDVYFIIDGHKFTIRLSEWFNVYNFDKNTPPTASNIGWDIKWKDDRRPRHVEGKSLPLLKQEIKYIQDNPLKYIKWTFGILDQ